MITYNGIDLFSSGPSATQPGELEGRDALAPTPGAIGASLVAQGVSARRITQIGTLVADDEPALRALINAIESEVALGQALLVDEFGNSWRDCVMRSFKHETIHRLGPRLAVRYTIEYLQTNP